MPYRHAHYWLIALVPFILLAFWPGYFSDVPHATGVLHAHAATAIAWITLVALQNWMISARHIPLHGLIGRVMFLVAPLFATGGILAMQSIATKFAIAADPFDAMFGARLALVDAGSVLALPALVCMGVAFRRKARTHAAAMIATVMLLLPPIFTRLLPLVPGFDQLAPAGLMGFVPSFYGAQAIGFTASAWLYYRDTKNGWPFALLAILILVQCLAFAVGTGPLIAESARVFAATPQAALALATFAVTLSALVIAWFRPLDARGPTRANA